MMGNQKYCHPLIILGADSRYLLTAKGLYDERFPPTKQALNGVSDDKASLGNYIRTMTNHLVPFDPFNG